MAEKSVMGSEGQITIPKSMREKYHLLEGEEVVLAAREEGVLVKHCPSSLRGRLKGKADAAGFERDIREIRAQWKLLPSDGTRQRARKSWSRPRPLNPKSKQEYSRAGHRTWSHSGRGSPRRLRSASLLARGG